MEVMVEKEKDVFGIESTFFIETAL